MWCKVVSTDTEAEIQMCDRQSDTAAAGRTIRGYFIFAKISTM